MSESTISLTPTPPITLQQTSTASDKVGDTPKDSTGKVITPEEVIRNFHLCRDLIRTGLRPGSDAEAVKYALAFLDSLISSANIEVREEA